MPLFLRTHLLWWDQVFIVLMPLAMVIAPIPMGTRVQSDYLRGWMVAVFMYVLTQGVAEYGMRPTPLGVLKVVGKTILGFMGFMISMVPSML